MKKTGIVVVVLIALGLGYAASQYFMPHRNIQSAKVFVEIDATQLVQEYLENKDLANEKYLDAEGESKVIMVKGIVKNITIDQNNQKVILLRSEHEKLGVSCTFTAESNEHISHLKENDSIKVKGVIRSGAEYDGDLELYEDVIVEKCDIIK